MVVLGWVTALGALWIGCAWGVGVVLGGVIERSRAQRCRPVADPLTVRGPLALVPAPAVADLVPRPRREPRAACARTGRSAGRGRD